MSDSLSLPANLAGWLAYIEALHPKSIAMGLDRVLEVKKRLDLNPQFPIITVGGTNGKGSTCAMLEAIYKQCGYQVGCYTSPHLLRYNERVRINGEPATDEQLCEAFRAVELLRGDTQLTYFEFGTLAAVWLLMQQGLDVVVLEVGLGGRLDAVNAFEPDCSIVCSVDLDHMEFLGDNRESIGFEKAGIFRRGKPALFGELNPPLTLLKHAEEIDSQLYLLGKNFDFEREGDKWMFRFADVEYAGLPLPALIGDFQLFNASCVLGAVHLLNHRLPVQPAAIAEALRHVSLNGRFQQVSETPHIILDVAHNPHAATALAKSLAQARKCQQTRAVFSMLADKDIHRVIELMVPQIDVWHIAPIFHPRAASLPQMLEMIRKVDADAQIKTHLGIADAYRQACLEADENDRIVVFGSFFTVAEVLQLNTSSAD